MSDERARRTGEAAREAGADWAVLTSVNTVAYATGHEVPVELGPSPFAGGPTTAFVAVDGAAALVVNDLERPAAETSGAQVVRSYEGLGFGDPRPLTDRYLGAVSEVVEELGVGGVVAVEPRTLPSTLREALAARAKAFVDVDPALERKRAVKTPLELGRLRRCAELTAVGQEAALEAARAGRSELEVFADLRRAMELAAGRRMPVYCDLISGAERSAGVMGAPSRRRLERGDPILCDVGPKLDGYWGDSCNTLFLGDPSEEFLRLYRAAERALAHAVERLRPGISAGAFDAEVRGVIESAGLHDPIHVGHGIGTNQVEYPYLVPGAAAVLEEGMVVMVEPGAYEPAVGGVRLEWMFLVTADGNEVLSPFEHRLAPGA